ncbi:unnamed protein product [Porites lobata]|uniref:Uncharacterized protein n=1 Tax=Porites lobata TaxID=104759 RepID=A0ABN8N5Q6_9CNID|nr:unnamed protein product [Porites lobata]
MVDECFPTHEIPTKTSAASTVSPINKSITLKSLLSKSVPPTPTGSTKSSETVEPLLSKNVTLKPTGSTKSSETVEPLLSKTVTLKPTGSTKSSEIVEPVSRKETYSTSSTKADESTKPGSQPLNSTTSVSPDQRHNLRGIIGGGILCGAILIICFIAFIKDFSQYRTLFCIRRGRKGLNRDEEQPLNEFEPDGDHLDNGRTTSRYSNDNHSATTSSAETISSENTQSTNDDTNFNSQQIHKETILSESTESTNDDTNFDAQQTHEGI